MDNPEPSTSSGISPPNKRRRRALSSNEKLMTANLYKYLVQEENKRCDPADLETAKKTECAHKTADILGVSKTTVYKILKEERENVEFQPPQAKGRPPSYKEKFDEFDLEVIRRKIHGFFFRNEAPTTGKVSI